MKSLEDTFSNLKMFYEPLGYEIRHFSAEEESVAYQACDFKLNKKSIKFRKAKITPTKIGQFVTLWKRKSNGPIEPFDINDPIDLFIISVQDGNNLGQFIFSKSTLLKQNILSKNKKGGKRAMRVYPPWVVTESDQAKKTQAWQVDYFLTMPNNKMTDLKLARMLLEQE